MSVELAVASNRAAPNDRDRAELIRGLYRNIPVIVFCMLLGAAAASGGMLYLAPARRAQVALWFGLGVAVSVWQVGLWAWQRSAGMDDADWRRWASRLTLAS